MLVVSIGCPAGIGPEVSVAAAARLRGVTRVLVGDPEVIARAAHLVGVPAKRLVPFREGATDSSKIYFAAAGPTLSVRDLDARKKSHRAGAAQLEYIEAAYRLTKAHPGAALVTGPVSKSMIAHSGALGAEKFRGHTEWLQQMDGARVAIMCFASRKLVTSLVTTHLPLARVPRALTPQRVCDATVELAKLLVQLGQPKPQLLVCSLNPHAGESELLGREEATAILPGIVLARKKLRGAAVITGPVGAETAYRKAYAARGSNAAPAVVAMYHDQATIPLKLVSFGDAVNVTLGLSIVRTSVDHGTAHDIAWQGKADASGMLSAMKLAGRLLTPPRG